MQTMTPEAVTEHERRAAEIWTAETQAPSAVPACPLTGARQGDLILRPIQAEPMRGDETGDRGVMIAAGAHGEHRMIAESLVIDGDTLHLADGGVLVHTDVPSARHRAIRFAPCVLQRTIERELQAGEVVNVRD